MNHPRKKKTRNKWERAEVRKKTKKVGKVVEEWIRVGAEKKKRWTREADRKEGKKEEKEKSMEGLKQVRKKGKKSVRKENRTKKRGKIRF